jgi:tRNA pseudouridine38-40 synthase
MRVRATVAYDGTDFFGFQRQATGRTVQAELEAALERVTQRSTRVLAAGRTDTGTHADGQVIAFETDWRHGLSDLQRALNALLPRDIAVRDLTREAPAFHPRYAAQSRHYRYTIYNAAIRSPLVRRTSLHVKEPLDFAAMDSVTALLVGEHDFAAFGRPTQGSVTVRRVTKASWTFEPPWLFFDIEANAFLFRMVRSIVGTLVQIGQGRMSREEFGEILASKDRGRAGPTVPAHGLCLVQVNY